MRTIWVEQQDGGWKLCEHKFWCELIDDGWIFRGLTKEGYVEMTRNGYFNIFKQTEA